MNNLEDFVDSLNISKFNGDYNGDSYIIEVNSSNDFSNLFNIISTNEHLDADDDSVATVSRSHFIYTDGYFEVELKADFDKDTYSAIVRER